MGNTINNFQSLMVQYVTKRITDPNTIEALKLEAKSRGIAFEEYTKLSLQIEYYNKGRIVGSLPIHMIKKAAKELDVEEALISSTPNQELSYSKVIDAEKTELSKELLLALLKRCMNGERADIRTIKLPSDNLPIDGSKTRSKLEYQQELIISIISILKEKLEGYEHKELNETYYEEKNINTRILSLSKQELDILFTIDSERLKHYRNDENLRKRVPNELRKFLDFLIDETEYELEHIGADSMFKSTYGINKEGCLNTSYSHRIYMNTPEGDIGYKFINEYIKKCVAHEIPYDMKAFFNSGDSFDRTILYSNNDYFLKHIEILESIALEHPDWLQHFGTPVHSTITTSTHSNMNVKNWYGVSLGQGVAWGTANDYFDHLVELSYVHLCYTNMPEIQKRFRSHFDKTSSASEFDRKIQDFEKLEYDSSVPFMRRANDVYNFAMSFYSDKELVDYCGRKVDKIISSPEKRDAVLGMLSTTVLRMHSIYQTGTDKLNANHPAISENMVNLYEKDKANRK